MMNAVVAKGPKEYEVTTRPVPIPAEGEVVLNVRAVGICGSDRSMWSGGDAYWGPGGRCSGIGPEGVVPGHETVGTVRAFGPGATVFAGIAVGDLVVVEQIHVCHACWYCKGGMSHKCDKLRLFGQGLDGGLAQFLLCPVGTRLYRIPAGVLPQHAVFAEPLTTSIHAAALADAKDGEVVVVAGCGAIGLGVIAGVLRRCRRAVIIAVDATRERLQLASLVGAQRTVEIGADDLEVVVNELTDGRGADAYVECSGAAVSIHTGVRMTRKCGRVVLVGIPTASKSVSIDMGAVVPGKELSLLGCNLGVDYWEEAVELIASGAFPMDKIAGRVVALPPLGTSLNVKALLNDTSTVKLVVDPSLDLAPLPPDLSPPSPAPPAPTPPAAVEKEEEEEEEEAKAPADDAEGLHPFSVSDAVIFVTGSSRGIGRGIAENLSLAGATVVIHGTRRTSPSTFGEGPPTMEARNKVFPVTGDLTDEAVVLSIVDSILAECGRIDGLVCCAGGNVGAAGITGPAGGKPDVDDALSVALPDVNRIMDVNLLTTILTCKAVVPHMLSRRHGRVVLVGSVAGCSGRSPGVLYAVSKAAVHEYGRCLAAQLRPVNINVNCIAPGPTVTHRFMNNKGLDHGEEAAAAAAGVGVTFDRPALVAEVAAGVGMLFSPAAAFIHGQVIRVDGGLQLFPA